MVHESIPTLFFHILKLKFNTLTTSRKYFPFIHPMKNFRTGYRDIFREGSSSLNDSAGSFHGRGSGPRKLGADARRAGQGRGHRSFSQFRGVRLKRGAVAAQGPPQLSDVGDLRRSVGGRRVFSRGSQPNGGNQRVQD